LGTSAHLSVYGLAIAVRGDWPEVVEAVRLDFAWFAQTEPTEPPDVEVVIRRRPVDLDVFGDLTAAFVTPRAAVYRTRERTIVDHLGRAVSVIDWRGDRLQVEGEDEQIVHDAVYYFVLGRVGEHVEVKRFARLHSLGIAGAQGAVAILLPSGGGKSTLALQALTDDGVRLLSEDSPLLDRHGRLHPFPLRIGINASDAASVPGGGGRRIERFWLPTKVAVEVETFADRIAGEAQPLRHIVLGRRSLGREAHLQPLPRRAAVAPLLRDGVLGLGLYQGLGYAHQRGLLDVVGKLSTAAGRARACAVALAGACVWQLILSRHAARNWAALTPLLH
jgi:hypothetical protein